MLPLEELEHVFTPISLKPSELFNIAPNTPSSIVDALEEYFRVFASPVKDPNSASEDGDVYLCFHCGEALNGMVAAMIGKGGFTWGLVHGEGFCRNCKWPHRAYHFIKDANGDDVVTIRGLVLAYLPFVVEHTNQNRDKDETAESK